MALAMIAGWAFSVSMRVSSGPSRITPESFWPSASSTSWNTSRAAALALASSAPMPTFWLPWPGKMKALIASLLLRARLGAGEVRRKAERHDLVRRIVADVGAAEVRNAGALAPVAGNFLRLAAERTVVFGHRAQPPEPQAGDPAQMLGDMEEQPVDR